ncbi:MAG: phosphoglycerate kinase [Bradymonadales bacterium]|nr:MAG: phosphoglycerate kinase [Bradymonadales bacterium]
MKLLKIEDLPWEKIPEKKRKVFLRVDYNVPLKDGRVLDDFRIQSSLPTIRKLQEMKAVIVIGSHLGRPQKEPKKKASLSLVPVAEHLATLLGQEVIFSEEIQGYALGKLISDAKAGEGIVFLENLRFHPEEEKNDPHFAEVLQNALPIYVNDAFGASHRAHASVQAQAEKTRLRAMGELLAREVSVLEKILREPSPHQMAVLGGAKIEDKIKVIESLLRTCRKIFIGGRMGLSFLAAQGLSLGGSRMEQESIQLAKRITADAKRRKVELFFPEDARLGESLESTTCRVTALNKKFYPTESEMILDIGPKTLESWTSELKKADRVLWNGPMGVFENPVFAEGTLGLVDFLIENREKIQAVLGGGETVAAAAQRGALGQLWHVSTGGGAMLEFLEGKALPGIEALKLRDREILQLQDLDLAS